MKENELREISELVATVVSSYSSLYFAQTNKNLNPFQQCPQKYPSTTHKYAHISRAHAAFHFKFLGFKTLEAVCAEECRSVLVILEMRLQQQTRPRSFTKPLDAKCVRPLQMNDR